MRISVRNRLLAMLIAPALLAGMSAVAPAQQQQEGTGQFDQQQSQAGEIQERRQRPGQDQQMQPSGQYAPEQQQFYPPEFPPQQFGQQQEFDERQQTGDRPRMAHEPGELGVFLENIPGEGVGIRDVVMGSPADEAGLRPGQILLGIDGRPVSFSQDVTQLVRQTPAGETVALHIWSNGQEYETEATLASLHGDREEHRVGYRGERAWDGQRGQQFMAADRQPADQQQLEQRIDWMQEELDQLREQVRTLHAQGQQGQRDFERQAERPQRDQPRELEQMDPPEQQERLELDERQELEDQETDRPTEREDEEPDDREEEDQ